MISQHERTFGVEIECLSPDLGIDATCSILRRNGFERWAENAYHDGSEIEIPSPILKGIAGFHELRDVYSLLRREGFRVTSDDGMHVHHGTEDLDFDQIKTIAYSWFNNQDLVKRLVSPSRRNGTWSRDLSSEDLDIVEREAEDKAHYMKNYGYGPEKQHQKYKSLSLYNRPDSGTIEIRLHQGTLVYEKARAWILFTQSFIHNVAQMKKPIERCINVSELLDRTGTTISAKRYLLAREQRLNPEG